MKEQKHTPGPWEATPDWTHDRMEIRDKDGRRIAICMMDYPLGVATHDANARLIAAAPAMYELLSDIMDELRKATRDAIETGNREGSSLPAKLERRIYEAVEKAEGKKA